MKNKNDRLIYHLLWMLIQYSSSLDEDSYYLTQGYNADAHSTDTLEKLGYIKILPLVGNIVRKWPQTKRIKFILFKIQRN